MIPPGGKVHIRIPAEVPYDVILGGFAFSLCFWSFVLFGLPVHLHGLLTVHHIFYYFLLVLEGDRVLVCTYVEKVRGKRALRPMKVMAKVSVVEGSMHFGAFLDSGLQWRFYQRLYYLICLGLYGSCALTIPGVPFSYIL